MPVPGQSCDNCAYYVGFQCRANPPVAGQAPVVQPDYWCGVWKSEAPGPDMTIVHNLRVRAALDSINNAVPAGGALQFDTVDFDTAGFAPKTSPFHQLTIPAGLAGIYMLTAGSSGQGNQATTLGLGVLLSGLQKYSTTNQSIYGPSSVNYILDCMAVEVLHMKDGDTVQLVNNSNVAQQAFKSLTLAMVRIGPFAPVVGHD
jgi:hypothetical protein